MNRIQIAAIMRKELREALRSTPLYVVTTFVYSIFLQWFIVRNYLSVAEKMAEAGADPTGSEAAVQAAVAFSLVYVAPMVLPFFANALLARSLIEERSKQSLMPVLATGLHPSVLWTTKLAASFCFSYAVVLVCLVLDVAMIRLYFGITIVWTPVLVVTAVVITPLASLGILALMSFLFWTVRYANMVASFLPVVLSLGLWAYVSANPTTGVLAQVVAIALGGSALMVVLGAFGIGRLSRQFLVGL